VAVLLYTANWLVHLLWQRGSDPDNASIPYLTAIGDLLGTVLLALSFWMIAVLGVDSHPSVTDGAAQNMTTTSWLDLEEFTSHATP